MYIYAHYITHCLHYYLKWFWSEGKFLHSFTLRFKCWVHCNSSTVLKQLTTAPEELKTLLTTSCQFKPWSWYFWTKVAFLTQVSVEAGRDRALGHRAAGGAQLWSFTSIFPSIGQCPSEASGDRRCLGHICHFESSVLGSFQLCFLLGDKACIF